MVRVVSAPLFAPQNSAEERFSIIVIFSLIFYVCGCLVACMSVHYVHAWCPWRPEEGTEYPETSVTDCWVPPLECWELNAGFQLSHLSGNVTIIELIHCPLFA